MNDAVEAFLVAVRNLVKGDLPYKEKIDAIRLAADEDDKTNLSELASWLEEMEEGEAAD